MTSHAMPSAQQVLFLGVSSVTEICAPLGFQGLSFVTRAGWLGARRGGRTHRDLPFPGAPPKGGKSSKCSCQGTEGELGQGAEVPK